MSNRPLPCLHGRSLLCVYEKVEDGKSSIAARTITTR